LAVLLYDAEQVTEVNRKGGHACRHNTVNASIRRSTGTVLEENIGGGQTKSWRPFFSRCP